MLIYSRNLFKPTAQPQYWRGTTARLYVIYYMLGFLFITFGIAPLSISSQPVEYSKSTALYPFRVNDSQKKNRK